MTTRPQRRAMPTDEPYPKFVVWELTLRCDLACRHCGSRAGKPRAHELSVDEARRVVDELAALGTAEVAFIGGEAYLHPGWTEVVRATHDAGIRCTMNTGGRAVDAALAQQAADAGVYGMSVSIDGLRATHDHLRAVRGSFDAAVAAVGHIRDAGMVPWANTQFNRLNLPEVEALAELLADAGALAWQVQLTGPMGRAADRSDWLLQPFELLDLLPRLAAVARRGRLTVSAANNLGYYGPHEQHVRLHPFGGCVAGRYVLGIESNGDVKGCPSLPSAPYVGGNVREAPIAQVWETARLRFARDRDTSELWGFCAGCYYKDVCRGGCSWTAHTALGRRGNMPWCYHRAETLRAQGVRERVVRVQAAPGTPFDFGRYALVTEPWEG